MHKLTVKITRVNEKTNPTTYCLEEMQFKVSEMLKVERWRKIYHDNTNKNQARVAVFILGKAVFKTREILRNKEKHYIIKKKLILQEGIIALTIEDHNP